MGLLMPVSVMLAGLTGEITMPYETVWDSPTQPKDGKPFLVTEQWWGGNYSERHIVEWEYVR